MTGSSVQTETTGALKDLLSDVEKGMSRARECGRMVYLFLDFFCTRYPRSFCIDSVCA